MYGWTISVSTTTPGERFPVRSTSLSFCAQRRTWWRLAQTMYVSLGSHFGSIVWQAALICETSAWTQGASWPSEMPSCARDSVNRVEAEETGRARTRNMMIESGLPFVFFTKVRMRVSLIEANSAMNSWRPVCSRTCAAYFMLVESTAATTAAIEGGTSAPARPVPAPVGWLQGAAVSEFRQCELSEAAQNSRDVGAEEERLAGNEAGQVLLVDRRVDAAELGIDLQEEVATVLVNPSRLEEVLEQAALRCDGDRELERALALDVVVRFRVLHEIHQRVSTARELKDGSSAPGGRRR